MSAYYNEHDPKAAAWIRDLIKAGLVAPGEVDERSIEDITPNELRGFTQCHFFAGIAVWSYALRQAGWPDDRQVWTGSCPCQPFSAAGKGEGFADERHLWPAWFHLIDQLRPITIFGEQVSSKDGLAWIDLVSDDLEGAGYSLRAVDIPACSVGAPHRRNRFYFVADNSGTGRDRTGRLATVADRNEPNKRLLKRDCVTRELADTASRIASNGNLQRSGQQRLLAEGGGVGELDNADRRRRKQRYQGERDVQESDEGRSPHELADAENREQRGLRQPEARPGSEELQARGRSATNGFWRNAEWLYCRDEKYRAVEPGTFPLANGIAGRVGLLRGYGNAIVAPLAKEFIEAYLELHMANG